MIIHPSFILYTVQYLVENFLNLIPYLSSAPFVILVIVFLLHPEKAEKWSALITSVFSKWNDRAERATVAREIQGEIEEIRRQKEFKQLLPYPLKIKWEKGETLGELREGEVMIIMDNHRSHARNFLLALMKYLSVGLVPEGKIRVPPHVARAIELVTAAKILSKVRIDALTMYNEELITPEVEKDAELGKIKKDLEVIDNAGLFTRIFLRELSDYGASLEGERQSVGDWEPVEQLISMLVRLAIKEPGVDFEAPFCVNKPNLAVCIVLVAKQSTLASAGTNAHVHFTNQQATQGIRRFYILARGTNEIFARDVVKKLLTSGSYALDDEEVFSYDRKVKTYLAALHLVKEPRHESEPSS